MAAPSRQRPARTLVILGVLLVAIFASIVGGDRWSDGSTTPDLALDLEGGTQLILTPRTTDGSEITDEDIDQAIAIMRQRVDASGVAESQITSQGSNNIVVGLPGTPSDETIELVGRSARLYFRPVLQIGGPGVIDAHTVLEEGEDPFADLDVENMTDEEIEEALAELQQEAEAAAAEREPATEEEIEEAARIAADVDGDGEISDQPATEPESYTDTAWITEQVMYDFYTLDCLDPANRAGGLDHPSDEPIAACDETGMTKYILAPSPLSGQHITQATSGMQTTQSGAPTGQWAVNFELDREGGRIFADLSAELVRLESQPPRNQFAAVLDGNVITAPTMNNVIPGGRGEITGSFTSESASTLANQLSFGSLPIDFEIQSQEQISATLGTEQLQRGLLAAAIGAVLVIAYLLWQYRALGLVAVSSLVLAGVVTYGLITLMSWQMGYRLSLPGVVGLAISVGVTADSFIVYFERVRDEVREGRTLGAAIEHGWPRAKRTILASDAVNFIAAAVLYVLAVGGVQGFAFTLGLVTLVDILVIFLFTHPVMLLLVKTKFFGQGHKLSGLQPESLGATSYTYRGRGRFGGPGHRSSPAEAAASPEDAEHSSRIPVTVGAGAAGGAAAVSTADRSPLPPAITEDGRKLTIAERRALQRKQASAAESAENGGPDPDEQTTEGGER